MITAIVLISVLASPKKKAPGNVDPGNENPGSEDPGKVDVCMTDSCKETAKIISENLDSSVDPCDDFYLYACGKFKENHPLVYSSIIQAIDSVATAAINRMYEVTKELTQKSFDNKGDSKAMKYVKTMLDLCIDTEKMENTGLAPLKELVKDLGHWKQTSRLESTESIAAKSYLDKMAKIMGQTGISLIQGLVFPQRFVLPKLDEDDRYTFIIAPQENIVPSLKEDHLKALKATIITAADLMRAPRIKQNVDKIIRLVADLVNLGTNFGQLSSFADPFKVAKLEESPFLRVTVDELRTKAPGIDWLDFFNKVFKAADVKKQFKATDTIVVLEIEKIKALKETLDGHDNDIIEDYIGLLLLKEFGAFATEKFRENLKKFERSITGRLNTLTQEENCVIRLAFRSGLDYLIARLYSDKYFDDDDKKDIQELVINLRDSFKDLLPSHDWLDDETRDAATGKADKIRINTGFPNFIKNNTKLDNIYPFVSISFSFETKVILFEFYLILTFDFNSHH